jgi:distribution and morphology protein 12
MFRFDWHLLTHDDELLVQDFLNESFKRVPRPDFVGEVSFSNFEFGDQPPVVQLLDIAAIPEDILSMLQQSLAPAGAGGDLAATPAPLPHMGAAGPVFDADVEAARREVSNSPSDENASDEKHEFGAGGSGGGGPGGWGGGGGRGSDDDADMMVVVKLMYDGNARFKVHSELLVNFPSPGFGRLPITLYVTKLAFSGTLMLLQFKGRVFVSFKNDNSVGPLKDLSVESEIGDVTRPVLKNARKVEQFIVEQLQKIIQRKLVFPNLLSAKVGRGAAAAAPQPQLHQQLQQQPPPPPHLMPAQQPPSLPQAAPGAHPHAHPHGRAAAPGQ